MRLFCTTTLSILVVVQIGCAHLGALPKEPGKAARVTNVWPLYRSIHDEEQDIRETQILWPFYKHRQVGDDSFLRLWPLYLSAKEDGETFPYCTEYQSSALSLLSKTESNGYRLLGIVHFNLLGYLKTDSASAVYMYPLWWPRHPTFVVRNGQSPVKGLLVDIDRSESGGFRFLNTYYRRGYGHGVFPLYGIHEDSWYFLGPVLTKLKDDNFIRVLLMETWPVSRPPNRGAGQ